MLNSLNMIYCTFFFFIEISFYFLIPEKVFLSIYLNFSLFWIHSVDDCQSTDSVSRIIYEQDGRQLDKYGIICNTCAREMCRSRAAATATTYICREQHTREFSREFPRRIFSGVFANRYIFIWQLLARGSTLVCTYVGTSHRAAETPTFRSKQNDLCARSPRLDLSSLLPPSFDLETPESINGASDFTFLECRGCADHSVIRADFPWDFRETRRYKIRALSENPDKYENLNELLNRIDTIHNKRFHGF